MIGLEFLINIYGLKNKNIADSLKISAVTVHDWITGKRKIPSTRIEQLSEIFKDIPKEYFGKELDDIDKLSIQKIKLENDVQIIEYEDTITDDETGEEITIPQLYVEPQDILEVKHLDYLIEEKKLHAKIQKLLNNCFSDNKDGDEDFIDSGLYGAYDLIEECNMFVELIDSGKESRHILRKLLLALKVAYGNAITIDTFVNNIAKEIKKYNEKTNEEV